MKVLILGASGLIGSAITDDLVRHGHQVLALARSPIAEEALSVKNVDIVRGDLRDPGSWSDRIREVEAVIHVAATFSDDMGAVDHGVVEALIAAAKGDRNPVRFLYTGGCWLYGETGNLVADEETPLNPINAFSWMVDNSRLVLNAGCFEAMILHPGMVYDRDGGAVGRFVSEAQTSGHLEVWGSLETRWPVVHSTDVASAYRLVLEKGVPGTSYNIAAQEGVVVGQIAQAVAHRFGLTAQPDIRSLDDIVAVQGDWAVGPTLDQQMSGQKIRESLGWKPVHTDILSVIS